MKDSGAQAPTMARRPDRDYFVKLVQTSVVTVAQSSVSSNTWSEGRKRFLQRHQERYLKRLSILREALLRENRNYARLSLPKNCDKNTGFWEAIMTEFEDDTIPKRFPNGRSQRACNTSVGGLTEEQNRRGHLERLRRIRIMQMRKRLPPQLEPLHGIGLGAKKDPTNKECNKQAQRVLPTAYHIDWMRGSHVITPIGDHERAINSWTLKHLRTVDTEPSNETMNNFPNDIRALLRKTRHSISDSATHKLICENKETTGTNKPVSTNASPLLAKSSRSQQSTIHKVIEQQPPKSPLAIPPPPRSTPTPLSPFTSEIISHHSSASSSRPKSWVTQKDVMDGESDEDVEVRGSDDEEDIQVVDRATSPVGFRLPPLRSSENSSRVGVTDSANSKRHIIVKIPHGVK